jgi:hypothetical protein
LGFRLALRLGWLRLVLAAYKYLLVIGEGIANQQTIFRADVMSLTGTWCLPSQTGRAFGVPLAGYKTVDTM